MRPHPRSETHDTQPVNDKGANGFHLPLRLSTAGGEVRGEDWDSFSDYLSVFRYVRWAGFVWAACRGRWPACGPSTAARGFRAARRARPPRIRGHRHRSPTLRLTPEPAPRLASATPFLALLGSISRCPLFLTRRRLTSAPRMLVSMDKGVTGAICYRFCPPVRLFPLPKTSQRLPKAFPSRCSRARKSQPSFAA